MTEPKELTKEEFITKLRDPEGFVVLLDDHGTRRYLLHVYRKHDMVVYASPRVNDMEFAERSTFVGLVEIAALHRDSSIRRYTWWG
jgi:hypothetical protein